MNRILPRALTAAATAAVIALVMGGCAASDTTEDDTVEWELSATTPAPSADIESFTWATYAEPYSLDYAYAFDYADNQVLANVCDSLLRLNPDYTLRTANSTHAVYTGEYRDPFIDDSIPLRAFGGRANYVDFFNDTANLRAARAAAKRRLG